MPTQRCSFRMALAAACLCLLGLFTQVTASYYIEYCSDINTSSQNRNYSQYQSNGLCHDFCLDNYAFAITQGSYCWCSNYAPAGDNSTDCTVTCPGWPYEICGNAKDGLYGYVSLSIAPSGTEGGGSSAAASTTATSTSDAPVTVTATPATADSVTVFAPSDDSSSSSASSSSSSSPSSSSSSSLSETSSSASTTDTKTSTSPTWTPTPVISVFTTTGQVRTITVTPTAPPNSQSGPGVKKSGSGGLGTGGAVGLTIGLVALIAIVGAIIWCCMRKQRQRDAEQYNNVSRRGSSAGLGGPAPSRTMSENSRYVLGTDGRQVVETWEPGDAPGSRKSRLRPVDPRLDPFAPVYQRGDNKSRESINTIRDDHDYSRRVVHQGPILRATNPDQNDD